MQANHFEVVSLLQGLYHRLVGLNDPSQYHVLIVVMMKKLDEGTM